MKKKKEKWTILKENKDYLISSWGRCFNLKTNNFIKSYIHKSRAGLYLRLNIGRQKFMTHVLVATYYVKKDCPTKTQVEHDDNNTLNPNENNLSWVTQSENQRLRHLKNKRPTLRRPSNPQSSLPNEAKTISVFIP